jgi:signal transduction histidine kinase
VPVDDVCWNSLLFVRELAVKKETEVEYTSALRLPTRRAFFQHFIQLHAQLSRQHEGSGLGLALIKWLAEQHGGSVRLDSSGIPGEGCCVTVTLPAA